ncbi:hypothetical protein D3C75_1088250 [compost metagenome]
MASTSAFKSINSSAFRNFSERARLEASTAMATLEPSGISFRLFTLLENTPMPAVGTDITLPMSSLLSAANLVRYTVCCIRLASISPLPNAWSGCT